MPKVNPNAKATRMHKRSLGFIQENINIPQPPKHTNSGGWIKYTTRWSLALSSGRGGGEEGRGDMGGRGGRGGRGG